MLWRQLTIEEKNRRQLTADASWTYAETEAQTYQFHCCSNFLQLLSNSNQIHFHGLQANQPDIITSKLH